MTGTVGYTGSLKAIIDGKAATASLAPVATAGTYSSLTGKPTLGTAAATDVTAFDPAGAAAAAAVGLAPLASPAFTGTPTIGGTAVAKTSDVTAAKKTARHDFIAHRAIRLAATIPTVTLSAANAATSISGGTLRAPTQTAGTVDQGNDPAYRYLGAPSITYNSGNGTISPATLAGSNASAKWNYSTASWVYCDQFEITFVAFNTFFDYRLRIDDEWVTLEAVRVTGLTAGVTYRLLVNFGTVDARKVQIDYVYGGFTGLTMAAAHSVHRADDLPSIPTVIAAADSITAGANAGTAAGFTRIDSWLTYAAELLGWRDVRNGGIAGTGFVNAGTDTAFTGRLADIAVAGARVVVYGGFNDTAASTAALQTAVDTVFTAIVAAGPAEFIVLGCHPANGTTYGNSTYTAINSTLSAKAAQYGATFIDPFAVKWVSGTGNLTTPNGTGNADLFVNADNTHPTRAGSQWLGRLYANAIAAATL